MRQRNLLSQLGESFVRATCTGFSLVSCNKIAEISFEHKYFDTCSKNST